MNKRIGGISSACVAIALSLVCSTGGAQDLGNLGSMIPGGGSMTSGSMGNVAGLLEYCLKNNYLGGNSGASGIKDQLMGKLGGGSSGATDTSSHGSSTSDMLGELTGSGKKKSSSTASSSDQRPELSQWRQGHPARQQRPEHGSQQPRRRLQRLEVAAHDQGLRHGAQAGQVVPAHVIRSTAQERMRCAPARTHRRLRRRRISSRATYSPAPSTISASAYQVMR